MSLKVEMALGEMYEQKKKERKDWKSCKLQKDYKNSRIS